MSVNNACSNFYKITEDFERVSGSLASNIWASYSGLWLIYHEVHKIHDSAGVKDWNGLERYLLGDVPKDWGCDLKSVAIDKIWDDHERFFEELILSQAFCLYEEWAVEFVKLIDGSKPRVCEVLQFPSDLPRSKLPADHPKTWVELKNFLDGMASDLVRNDYQNLLINRYVADQNSVDCLLRWYRFFKECKNSYDHAGGVYTDNAVDAYQRAVVQSLGSVGMTRGINLPCAPVKGTKIYLGPANAVLVLGVVGRLANAFDAILCHSISAERYMIERINASIDAGVRRTPGKNTSDRVGYMKRFLSKAGLPLPSSWAGTEKFFKENGWIVF